MKLTKFFLYTALVAVLFSACKSEIDVTGVTLDESAASVAIKDSMVLTATILPKGATGTVVWSSSNDAVATVKDGKVKGVSLGTANIKATVGTFSAVCAVTVTKEVVDFQSSLNGTEYYLISMDGVTAAKLGSKVKADFRPDELSKHLYIWPDGTSYSANTTVGPNVFGEVEPWVSLTVGTLGWSGAGFNVTTVGNETSLATLKAITDNPNNYYLHIGIKSTDNTVHSVWLDGQTTVKFALGATGFVDNGITYPSLGDFPRDGEWQKIEIPMKTLKDMGLTYSNLATNPNIISVLSGGVSGKRIDLDAVFIYKK